MTVKNLIDSLVKINNLPEEAVMNFNIKVDIDKVVDINYIYVNEDENTLYIKTL